MPKVLPHFDVEVSVDEINPDLLRVIWFDEVADDGIESATTECTPT